MPERLRFSADLIGAWLYPDLMVEKIQKYVYVIYANRAAKMRELDALLSGVFITRAAISGVSADGFDEFMEDHFKA